MQIKPQFKIVHVFLFFLFLSFSHSNPTHAQPSFKIDTDTTWTAETPDLVFNAQISIENNATLTIEKGTKIVFNVDSQDPISIPGIQIVSGKLIANGTKEENIFFTSPDNGFSLFFNDNTQTSQINYVAINGGGFIADSDIDADFPFTSPLFNIIGGKLLIENSKFENSNTTEAVISDTMVYDIDGNPQYDENNNVIKKKAQIKISNSLFSSQQAVISNIDCATRDENNNEKINQECLERVYLKNNWYGDPRGPTTDFDKNHNNIKGFEIAGFHFLDLWNTKNEILEEKFCSVNCFSNVLFLPGIKASRLYKKDVAKTEDQLWLPNYFGNDLKDLAMDENGKSIKDVYTKDVLDETVIPKLGSNIYKTFLKNLSDLKNNQTINDYEAFAYDWRQSADDIAKNGTGYENFTKSIIVDIQNLAKNSKSQKVTIIAHSNGGLVAKAAMLELEKIGLSDKVDKIILIGAPQMGTPLTILSLLYGYDESLLAGTLISKKDARTLAENMPGAYGLLPGEKYFQSIAEPFINFSSRNTAYKKFQDAYGENIDSFEEFKKFLLGTDDHRKKPKTDETDMENILNQKLLTQAEEMHQKLDNWIPPQNIQIIQIAGWGLDTVSDIDYAEKEKTRCSIENGAILLSCSGTGEYEPVYEPKFTVDGDKVVVTPSALMLPEKENVKRYWVDLYRSNTFISNGRNHKDILELGSIQNFLENSIKNTIKNNTLPNFIKTSRPDDYDNAKPRLRLSLHSPLDIHLYDDHNNHTGPKTITDENGQEQIVIEENIPNSYYYQFGERKYVGFPKGEHIRAELKGYDTGSYTLKIKETKGEEIIAQTAFENLPTTPETKVKLDIPQAGIEQPLPLKADIDGNGKDDYRIKSVPNGESTLSDTIPPATTIEISGTQGKDDWYLSNTRITLNSQDNDSGVEKINYSLDNGKSWKIYTKPVYIHQEGIIPIQYFSTDKQGINEEIKTQIVKIDKTPPDAQAKFNQKTQSWDIVGVDNISKNVSVTTNVQMNQKVKTKILTVSSRKNNTKEIIRTATLADEAGNMLNVVLREIGNAFGPYNLRTRVK